MILWISSFIAAVLASCTLFDRLVKLEHSRHRSDWEKDGRPHGYVWQPAERGALKGIWNREVRSAGWYLRTPDWVQADSEARSLLRKYRWMTTAAIVIGLVLLAGFLKERVL